MANLDSPLLSLAWGTPKWSGTVSKRKGQKWGREKNFNCSNDDNALPAQLNVESVVKEVEDNKRDPLTAFEKLFPLTQLPKEGDVLAYRVVELSSSWCPEISSFRVGKVTSYDPTSGKIILMQVPDFPVSFCERDEGSGVQPDEPMYKEDGSLEIDFPSLLDVRLFNEYKATMNASISEIEATGSASPVGIKEPGSSSRADHKDSGVVQPTESEGRGGWEEICQALDAKKAELSQEKGWSSWGRKETPTTTKWSYRALRWGALGPTVSLLRSKNDM
ncbi:hypothetical protein Taro_007361 [Colocasia esculenta]|uniref:Coilin tudor domain-containing protein n=1 Tax=Colocasia esculenta TaxID=4460 RepID=A0A843TUU6_COLES|nr:hypothetical protein [Colocasia esculenta]